MIIEEWDRKRKQLNQQFEHREQLSSPVESWKPEENQIVEVSEVDQMEKAYNQEYDLLVEKDKAEGKDFNWLAFEEMKKAQYFFKFLRDNEKEFKKTQAPKKVPDVP